MKYNKNEVTGKMRDRIILQNVNRSRSLTGFASESWADVATIWAFAESKLPGSNETIIEGKNTAKNICDFTIRYISSITEESRVVFKNKIYQVKNIKISHDRRFISFQGVYYDSYSTVFGLQFCSASLLAQSSLSAALMRVIKYQASLNAFGSVSADIALVQKVASSLNAFGTLTGDISFVKNMQAALNGTAALSGGINFVQKPEASLNAFGTLVSDLKIAKTFESSLNANGTLVSNATIAKILASSLTSSNSLAANALVSKLASASLTGAGTTAANLTVTSSASLLLDLYPSAAAAYSLRKLRSAYTGSAIRVRRSSDNTEQDIGFDVNGNLDTTALTTFCGVGNGFVTTWYDQSGNANNATQTTQANQPQIVSSGSVIIVNNKPGISFTNTNRHHLNILSSIFTYTGNSTLFHVSRNRNNSANQYAGIIGQGGSLSGQSLAVQWQQFPNTQTRATTDVFGPGGSTTSNTQNINTQYLATFKWENWSTHKTNGNTIIAINGVNQSLTAYGVNPSNLGFTPRYIGAFATIEQSSSCFLGDIQEIVVYTAAFLQTNIDGAETNINTHYAIY